MKDEMLLEAGETLQWEARPAPRCYTFRHWQHALFGLFFLAVSTVWQFLGVSMAEEYARPWLAWLPIPFVLVGLYFFCGHLVQARLEWDNVLYRLTDRRMVVRRGLLKPFLHSLDLSELTYFRVHWHSEQLGTLRLYRGKEACLVLHCVEHPQPAIALLKEAVARNAAQPAEA